MLSEVRHGNRSVFNIKCLESILVIRFSTAYSLPYLRTYSVSILLISNQRYTLFWDAPPSLLTPRTHLSSYAPKPKAMHPVPFCIKAVSYSHIRTSGLIREFLSKPGVFIVFCPNSAYFVNTPHILRQFSPIYSICVGYTYFSVKFMPLR